MPPSLLDWVSADHVVWTILSSVAEMDLSAFYGDYRADGHGRPAYEPSMMVALLLHAYARGNRSSRAIERACREDVVYRVICTNLVPDHSTIAEFRKRHETALAELFTSVLSLCREAGLVSVGVIAVDGTKVKASASRDANLGYAEVVREILREADAIDRAEDEQYGDARGDEVPEQLRTPEGRRAALRAAKERLQDKTQREGLNDGEASDGGTDPQTPVLEFDAEKIVRRVDGREGWLRVARAQVALRREREARPVARDRLGRLLDGARRLEEDHAAELEAMRAYEHFRAHGRDRQGRRLSSAPRKPWAAPQEPAGKVNTTDPDSRVVKTMGQPGKQGYNAQAAVNEHQIVIAAEVVCRSGDFGLFGPMVDAAERELSAIGYTELPDTVVADAGYWHTDQMEAVSSRGMRVLIPPDSRLRTTTRPGWEKGPYARMRALLETAHAKALYKTRQTTIEPVFGQIKFNRKIDRFQRRGHAAVRSEWRLATATHNLMKLHNHRIAIAGA
ncbi:MAG: transposase [Solirubrobacteraceae bacterium]